MESDKGILFERKSKLRSWIHDTSRQLHLNQSRMTTDEIRAWWFVNFGIRMPKDFLVKEIFGEDKHDKM